MFGVRVIPVSFPCNRPHHPFSATTSTNNHRDLAPERSFSATTTAAPVGNSSQTRERHYTSISHCQNTITATMPPRKTTTPRRRSQAAAAAPPSPETLVQTLIDIQKSDYSILKLSEPLTTASSSTAPQPRTSDISTASVDPTPATLEADLAHYRELFAKLRFSYVEQVTKEKFIRAIVGDPPLIVTPAENAALEEENAAAKAALKALKTEVAGMVAALETRGRELAGRLERVKEEGALADELPKRIEELQGRVSSLRAEREGQGGGEGMDLPLGKTRGLVEGKRKELEGLERLVEGLERQVPRKRKEAERLGGEVAALENRRANSAAAAREAKRRRENAQGGVEDELEARGRWYRASETVLRQVLDLKG